MTSHSSQAEAPSPVAIDGQLIGPGQSVFVIAEAGVNHNGDPEIARQLADAAAASGADAVKFQTFVAERLASDSAPKAAYQLDTTDAGESQVEMLRRLELAEGDYEMLARHCAEAGVRFLSTPFDEHSADLLDGLGMAAFKLGSGEVTNLPLLECVASKNKPVLLSTGMATLDEVAAAVDAVRACGNDRIVLLHCVSSYPAPVGESNLRAIESLATLGVPVGYSDHTTGAEAALAAVALGACVIEKHFTLDTNMAGPDHKASLPAGELPAFVESIRRVESALGTGVKEPQPVEVENRRIVRRSLVARTPISEGAPIAAEDLIALRPGDGISPMRRDEVVGRRAARDIVPGAQIAWEDLS